MAEKIMIASGKGGVGKSSLTAGLARALALSGHRTLVFDMDIGLRSLDLIFAVEKEVVFDWGNVIDGECGADQAPLKTDGPELLAAPLRTRGELNARALRQLVEELESGYDFILFDAPAGVAQGFEMTCCAAQRGIVVSTADSVCVRGVNITAAAMRKAGIEDVRLVINRFDERAVCRGKLLNIDDVIDATGARLLGVVPEDAAVSHCAVRGRSLPARSPAARAFARIAGRLCGEESPLFGG